MEVINCSYNTASLQTCAKVIDLLVAVRISVGVLGL